MSGSVKVRQAGLVEHPDPIVVFSYHNSPARPQDSSQDEDGTGFMALDWSRIKQDEMADLRRLKSTCSSDNSTVEDTSADGSRLQIVWESEHSETFSQQSECSESSETMVSSSMENLPPTNVKQGKPKGRWEQMVAIRKWEIPVVYHENMARAYPERERTPTQVEQRRRNTVAARISRARVKMAEMMLEKEGSEASTENVSIKRALAAKLVYANVLRTLLGMAPIKLIDIEQADLVAYDIAVE